MTATQEQLAALAALVGITPETHRHLWIQPSVKEQLSGEYPKLNFPALDTAAGDDVFGMPLIRWVRNSGYKVEIWSASENPRGKWGCRVFNLKVKTATRFERIAAYGVLTACQAAGVPEIVAIFGRKSDAD